MIGARDSSPRPREDRDLSAAAVLGAVALCIPLIFALSYLLSRNLWLSAALALALCLIGFFATAVAGYLTGIVGASSNPVSGITIIVLLAIAVILKLLGVDIAIGPRLAIMAGAVVCTAAAMAGDSLHDLATGFHVGATPRSLEIAVLFGAALSAFAMAPVLNLLIRGYGIAGTPTARAQALAAPQAFLMAKVAQGVFKGGIPLGTIACRRHPCGDPRRIRRMARSTPRAMAHARDAGRAGTLPALRAKRRDIRGIDCAKDASGGQGRRRPRPGTAPGRWTSRG